jgi:tRNA pseudouridine55 synthase
MTDPAARKIPRREVDGILVLDKPRGISSNTALQHVKRLFRAAKAGHTGSLDPLATGVLPLCFGQATKLCGFLLDSEKRYRVRASVGARTATGDAEGEVTARSDATALERPALEGALAQFTGARLQLPPMYSALHHEGRRLYELAREGRQIEREPRAIVIHELVLTGFGAGWFELDVRCSKGTYIRTLVEDIAAACGQCAHVAMLARTAAGPFSSEQRVGMEAIDRAAAAGEAALDALLQPTLSGLAGWQQVRVDSDCEFQLGRGQAVRVVGAPASGQVAMLDGPGRLLGIGEIDLQGRLAPKRWMAGTP